MEWATKYYSRRCRSVESRQLALENLMKRERWTSNSPLASEVPLIVEFHPTQYGMPPDKLPSPKVKKITQKTQTKPKIAKRGFKKKLYGVTY